MMKLFLSILGIGIFIIILSSLLGWCNDAVETTTTQFKPSVMLEKYSWFKDASAQLDAKVANLNAYPVRFESMRQSYGADSSNRAKWAREDREQYNIWESEFLGLKQSYNELAATYNAQMAKWNYKFTNRGDMPAGAEYDKVLPKEYKPYLYQ